jgi:hypothetical protein
MARRLFALGLFVALAATASAQPPAAAPAAPRFKWEAGQTLAYRVVQVTTVSETTLDEKTNKPTTGEAKTSLTIDRKWTVKAVDAAGVATLEMSITAMKNEFRQPDGSVSGKDSSKPEDAKEMAAYLNTPIVVVRMDTKGNLVEVKEAKGGTAARLQAELPFRLTLPDAAPAANATWDRPFVMKLDPPHGTGESYDFAQKYTSKGEKDGYLIVGVDTALKNPPKNVSEQVPLVPMLWNGDVYFHPATGRYAGSRLKSKAELVNFQGEGTKFVYESSYSEDWVQK